MNALHQVSGATYLTPAYGAKYSTDEELLTAWKYGKDFKIVNGPYCSIRDIVTLRRSSSNILITRDYKNYITV